MINMKDALQMWAQSGRDAGQGLAQLGKSLGDLANQRSIQGANDSVQQIKDSEASDAQKQAQIRNIANQLAVHLNSGPSNITGEQIQGITNGLAPKPASYQNPFEAFSVGSADPKQAAVDWENLQNQNAIKKQSASAENGLAALRFKNEKSEFATKQINEAMKQANAVQASSRSPLGTLQLNKQKLDKMESLFTGDPSKMNSAQQAETVADLDTVFTGGVGSDSGRASLLPHTLQGQVAKAKEYVSGSPQALNTPDFTNMYADMKDRLQGVIGQQKAAATKQILRTKVRTANLDPDSFNAGVQSLLPGDSAHIVNNRVVFDSDIQEAKVAKTLGHILDNSDSPDAKEAIAQIQDHPNYIGAIESNPKLANRLRAYFKSQRSAE